MSRFRLYDATSTGFEYEVRLTSSFSRPDYERIVLTTESFSNGVSSIPSWAIAKSMWSYSGASRYQYGSFSGQSPSTTYYLWAYAQAGNGKYYEVGSSQSITTLADAKRRPNNWSWGKTFRRGGSMRTYSDSWGDLYAEVMTARDWNAFTDRINSFRDYEGYSNYSFTTVYSGDTFDWWVFNQAVTSIDAMYTSTSTPYSKSRGDTIVASDFNRLRDALNSIR